MNVSPGQISHREFYHILISAIAPRPIAWVSTLNREGIPNLAPFSFFTVVSANPPLLGFAPALRKSETGSDPKDTLRNIRESREFVVNIVTFEVADAMNLSSGDYDHSVNEFELSRLAIRPSSIVKAPQVAESPVSFECRLHQILDFGSDAPSGSFVIGEIVSVTMKDEVLKEGRLDRDSLDLIGRMGGHQYSRTRQRFDLVRPKAEDKG